MKKKQGTSKLPIGQKISVVFPVPLPCLEFKRVDEWQTHMPFSPDTSKQPLRQVAGKIMADSIPKVSPSPAASSSDESTGLPLGWTRVKRRRIDEASSLSAEAALNDGWCCEDPSCDRRPFQQLSLQRDRLTERQLSGTAMFCFHEPGPAWFQGYVTIGGSRKAWGLLAVQSDVEPCLECTDGGYREIDLSVNTFQGGEPTVFSKISWTGGDMMNLHSAKVAFEAERLVCGKKAIPIAETYFSTIVNELRCPRETNPMESDSLLEMAVVFGRLHLVLPCAQEHQSDGNE